MRLARLSGQASCRKDRANRQCVSVGDAKPRFDPTLEHWTRSGEGQPPATQKVSTTTRFDFGRRCEIAGELRPG